MDTSLAKQIDPVLELKVFTKLLENEYLSSREIAEQLDMRHEDVMVIISSPSFIEKYFQLKTGQAKIEFLAKNLTKLQDIIENEKTRPKDVTVAIATLHKILFPSEAKKGVTVNINLEKLLEED